MVISFYCCVLLGLQFGIIVKEFLVEIESSVNLLDNYNILNSFILFTFLPTKSVNSKKIVLFLLFTCFLFLGYLLIIYKCPEFVNSSKLFIDRLINNFTDNVLPLIICRFYSYDFQLMSCTGQGLVNKFDITRLISINFFSVDPEIITPVNEIFGKALMDDIRNENITRLVERWTYLQSIQSKGFSDPTSFGLRESCSLYALRLKTSPYFYDFAKGTLEHLLNKTHNELMNRTQFFTVSK